MGLFNRFPYTNFHELNLDWILRKMREIINKVQDLTNKVENLKLEGLPAGGTTGQTLTKASDTDYDVEWKTANSDYLPLAGGTMNDGAKIAMPGGEMDVTLSGNKEIQMRISEDGIPSFLLKNDGGVVTLSMFDAILQIATSNAVIRFESVPQCAIAPTADNELVNKKYVDENGGSYTLPAATAEALGGIKAPAKLQSDTVPVRIGDDNRLYCEPSAAPAASASVGTGKLYEYTFPYTAAGGVVTLPAATMNSTILSEQTFGVIDIAFSHNPGVYSAALKYIPIPTRVYIASGVGITVALYCIEVSSGALIHVGDLVTAYAAADWHFNYADGVACSPALSDSLMLRWVCSSENRVQNNIGSEV